MSQVLEDFPFSIANQVKRAVASKFRVNENPGNKRAVARDSTNSLKVLRRGKLMPQPNALNEERWM